MKQGAVLAVVLLGACGADNYAGSGDDDGWSSADAGYGAPECFSSNECPTGWTCSEFGTCVPPTPEGPDAGAPPPEVEYELSPPVASRRYVYVAMTELDAIAKIDGRTLSVSSVHVGDQPRVLAAVPGSDTAVVLDQSNGTATVVRPTSEADQTTVLPILPNLNQIRVDPSGRYAVAWFDLATAGTVDLDEIGSFQDVTVIDLALGDEKSVDLTVGFRPRAVEFDAAGDRAYVVTYDGVSVIELAEATTAGPHIVPPIPITADPLEDTSFAEVNVVASGEYAVVRPWGGAELRVVDLLGGDRGALVSVPLPETPSDVDLAPDGAHAYAVLRDSSALAIVSLPDGALEVLDLGGEVIGSLTLSRDGARGLAFTNAAAIERITVVELAGARAVTTYPLQKSIRFVDFDPTGEQAIILHAKEFGDPAEPGIGFDAIIDRSHGYSVFDVATGFAKLQLTPVQPGSFAFADGFQRAYLILDGGDGVGATARAHIIELDTGVVRAVELNSPPSDVGVLPDADVAYINQRHGLGRVSFIDIQTNAVRTITGFDLNGRIVD